MRKQYLVSYDIRESGRLRRVHKMMRGYGDSLQYSVFLCDLSEKEKMLMVAKLSDLIVMTQDSLLIVDLGSSEKGPQRKIETIGKPLDVTERNVLVI